MTVRPILFPGDVLPEHSKRKQLAGLHPEVAAAYDYVQKVVSTADDQTRITWHGWALREAFLAGCSHSAIGPDHVPIPQNPDQAVVMVQVATSWLFQHAPERLKTPNVGGELTSRLAGVGQLER